MTGRRLSATQKRALASGKRTLESVLPPAPANELPAEAGTDAPASVPDTAAPARRTARAKQNRAAS